MQGPQYRAKETRELIRQVERTAARRRRIRVIVAGVGTVLFAGLVAAVLMLTWPGQDQAVSAETTTTTARASNTLATLGDDTGATGETTVATESIADTVVVTTTSEAATTTTTAAATYVVVIDPGHQAEANGEQEPIGPGSTETKDKVSSGTRSINTGQPESQLVLAVSLKLRDALEAQGIEVVMTRTTEDVDISNSERAQIANVAEADLFIRVHADGAADTSVHGVLMLYPATVQGWTDDIAAESKRAAQLALDALVAATGAYNRGMVARSDITGFNWSDVPVILPEIGLMTNKTEDALLATDEYQNKIVQGLVNAILEYLEVG